VYPVAGDNVPTIDAVEVEVSAQYHCLQPEELKSTFMKEI